MMSPSQPHLVEMHCHTVFSPDARRTPEELVEVVAARGARVFSITDHNHLGAQDRAARHAARFDMRYVSGVEISAAAPNGLDCHFVCYGVNPRDPALLSMIAPMSAYEPMHFAELYPHLKEYGYEVPWDELVKRLPERYPTYAEAGVNLWIAREYLMEQGQVPDSATFARVIKEIQQKLRDAGQMTEWPRTYFEPMRDAVHNAGGKVLLAHVARYLPGEMDRQLAFIEGLMEIGLDGFELYHPTNLKEAEFHRLEDLARHTDCLLSCGSDCHDALDEERNQRFGQMEVEDWVWERLPGACHSAT